jgi:hypothetical protein
MARSDVLDSPDKLVDVALIEPTRPRRSLAEIRATTKRPRVVHRASTFRIEQWTRFFVRECQTSFVFPIR